VKKKAKGNVKGANTFLSRAFYFPVRAN
jgi:hypothetical protein